MQKKTLLMMGFVLTTSLVQAQFYMRAGGGYALPVAKQVIGTERHEGSKGNTVINNVEVVKASFGSGANFNIGAGYMFSKYFGADLNISYLIGRKFTTGYFYEGDFEVSENYTETNSKSFFLTPTFVITTGEGTKVPYARFGAIIGAPKMEQDSTSFYNGDGVSISKTKWEQSKGLSFGFSGTVGMNWILNNNFKIFSEVTFVSMTYYPKERTMTESSIDGVSNLDQKSVSQKETEYVDKLDYTSINRSDPNKELQVSIPFSSIALQVGVVYVFGGINID